jgi:hypothetical protein
VETPPSSTPILDFQQPLPQSLESRVTGAAASPFLMLVGAIVVSENYAALAIPFGIVLTLFLTSLFHEMGHLVAGRIVGMRFSGVLVGPFALDRTRTGFHFRFTRFWARGLAYMTLPDIRNVRRRLIVFGAGGPVASLVCGVAALVAGEILRARSDAGVGVLELFGLYSVLIGIVSFRSFRVGPYAGDGMLLRALTRNREGAKQLVAMYASGALAHKTPDGVNWNDRWSRVAEVGPFTTQYHRDFSAYSRATNSTEAAQMLEKCLAQSAFLRTSDRDILIAEVIKVVAWDRRDLASAQRWLGFLQSPEELTELTRARMEVAICAAGGDIGKTLHYWNIGLQLIQASADSPTKERYEEYWFRWKDEIIARLNVGRGPQNGLATHPAEFVGSVVAD